MRRAGDRAQRVREPEARNPRRGTRSVPDPHAPKRFAGGEFARLRGGQDALRPGELTTVPTAIIAARAFSIAAERDE